MGKRFTSEQFDHLTTQIRSKAPSVEEADEQILALREWDDPVYWSEQHFLDPDTGELPLKVRKAYYPFLRDGSRHRALRVGRQNGKTVHSAIDILHTAYFEKNSIILVMVTQKKLMNRMLEIMSNYLRKSDLKDAFKMKGGKKVGSGEVEPTYDYEITVGNGFSHIRFFFLGNNPDKVRGQRATHIYIDEADYYPDAAWPVITGIIKGRPDIRLTTTSTPCGIDGTWFFNFCKTCRDPKNTNGNEYHIKPDQEENWPEVERQLRMVIFDEISWQLEVMAEFVEAKGAVYKKELITAAVERGYRNGIPLTYDMIQGMLEYESAPKFLGVDWNVPQNGVRLVEVATLFETPVVTRNERISYEQFTQTGAVQHIMRMFDQNHYVKIAVDAGYGECQIELLTIELAKRGLNPKDVLIAVDAGKKETITVSYGNAENGTKQRREISIKVKQRLVELVAKYLERNLTFMPSEDINFDGLVKEARNFQRKKGTQDNFIYSDNTHSLSALQHALYIYDLYHDECDRASQLNFTTFDTSSLKELVHRQHTSMITNIEHTAGFGTTKSRCGGLDDRTSRTSISY